MKLIYSLIITLFFIGNGLEVFGQCVPGTNAAMSISGANTACEGQPIMVENNVIDPSKVDYYVWHWNAPPSIAGFPYLTDTTYVKSDTTYIYNFPDSIINCNFLNLTFEIRLEVQDICNTPNNRNQSPVTISVKPRASFSATTPVCDGTQMNFINTSCPNVNPGMSYHWDFGVPGITTDVSTLENPSYIYPTAGTYTVTLTVSNDAAACNLTDTYTMQVEVLDKPVPQYTLSASSLNTTQDTICQDDVLTISNQSLHTDSVSYIISPNSGYSINGNSNLSPQNITLSTPNDYSITMQAFQCDGMVPCNTYRCMEEVVFNIHVKPSSAATLDIPDCVPDFLVDFSPYFQTFGSPPNGVVWQFLDLNNTSTHQNHNGVTAPTIDYTTIGYGTYIVKITYPDACNNVTLCDTFTIGEPLVLDTIPNFCLGANDIIPLNDLVISPTGLDLDWSGTNILSDTLYIGSFNSTGTQTVFYQGLGCSVGGSLTFEILDGATISLSSLPTCYSDSLFNIDTYIQQNGTYDSLSWKIRYLPNPNPTLFYSTLYPGNIPVLPDSTEIKVSVYSQCGIVSDSAYIYIPAILALDTLLAQCSNVDTCINLNDLIQSPTGLCLTWSGPGVVNNCFNPSNANIGFNTISYTGCTDACYQNSFTVEVYDGSSNLPDMQVCINSDTIFLDNIQDGVWSGNGVTNDYFLPIHATEGTHILAFHSNLGSQCYIIDTIEITVDSAVTAVVSTNSPNCVDSIFTFDNISNQNIMAWSFTNSLNDNVTHTYNSANTYEEYLVVGNTTCRDTAKFPIIVEPIINTTFSIDNVLIECEGATVSLSIDDPDDSYHYFWDVDGNTDTSAAPTFFIKGSFVDSLVYLNLTITNTCGSLQLLDSVLVPAIFNAGFGALQTNQGCAPFNLTFANVSTGFIDSFVVHYDNGSPSSTDTILPQVYYNFTDTILIYETMLVIYSAQCGTDTAYQYISVIPSQIEGAMNIESFSGCEPFSTRFICYSTPGTISTIYFGDGSKQTGIYPEDTLYFSYDNAGVYYPYIVAIGCGIDTFYMDPVTVLAQPDIGFLHQLQACEKETIAFVDTSITNIASQKWFVDGILVDSLNDLAYRFDQAGIYTVTMQATSVLTGCIGEISSNIEILDNPNNLNGISVSPTIGCYPLTVNVEITEPYDSVKIDFGNGQVRFNPSSTIYRTDSIYTMRITLFNNNGCAIDSTILIEVLPPISVAMMPKDTTIQLGDKVNIEYQTSANVHQNIWIYNDSFLIDNFQQYEHQPNILGLNTYEIHIEDENGCPASDTGFVRIKGNVLEQVYIPNAFTPNQDGNNDLFTIHGDASVAEIKTLQIYDRWGELVFITEHIPPNILSLGWDGTVKEEHDKTPIDVYAYRAILLFIDGTEKAFEGNLSLIR